MEKTIPNQVSVPVKAVRVSVVEGPDEGAFRETHGDSISIGTAENNDLVLRDATVSRYHLELRHLGDRIQVEDLKSTNGTLSGKVWIEKACVAPGAELRVGNTLLRVQDGESFNLELHPDPELAGLKGQSATMRKLMASMQKAAKSNVSVLLVGETGVGKEIIARSLHDLSPRSAEPFETVDCGTLTPNLIASELFGHEKGAFTGAERTRVGAFERANGGTIFLDEIGELPAALQVNLLGALERRQFRRVGGDQSIAVDVRVLCATNRDLRAEVNGGTFRADLYYRLAVVSLSVPSLRERTGDIPLLVEHFLREAGFTRDIREVIPVKVMQALMKHRWPGNVRELRNVVEAALAMGEAPEIARFNSDEPVDTEALAFPGISQASLLQMTFKNAREAMLEEFQRVYLEGILERCGGNVSRASREADIHRSYLNQMIKRHKLRSS